MSDNTKTILHPADFQLEMIDVNGLKMHVALDGPTDGPLVILLHGFPEFWYSWRHQIKALAAAGFRVAAPDQRGYNLTDKTPPFDVFTLAGDVRSLVKALGREKAFLAGHDWGGGVAWIAAALYPETFERLAVCNCPHPAAIIRAHTSFYVPQITRSWYIFFFQLPGIPESLLSRDNFKALAGAVWGKAEGAARLTKEEKAYYREAWAQPGAITAMITWYRTMVRRAGDLMRRDTKVRIPARLIWGEPDFALTTHVAELSREYYDGPGGKGAMEIKYIPNTGHFVQQAAPEEVSRLMLEFLFD